MIRVPVWAKKPTVKDGHVIATDRGWVHVRPNGVEELLVSVRGLDEKMREFYTALQKTVSEYSDEPVVNAVTPEPVIDAVTPEPTQDEPTAEPIVAEKQPAKVDDSKDPLANVSVNDTPRRKPGPKPGFKRDPNAKKPGPKPKQ